MDAEQILAFRLARSGLADRGAASLAEAAAAPASDFSRDAALLAVAARVEDVTRRDYDSAVDAGELVVANVIGAIHALRPEDPRGVFALTAAYRMREQFSKRGRRSPTTPRRTPMMRMVSSTSARSATR